MGNSCMNWCVERCNPSTRRARVVYDKFYNEQPEIFDECTVKTVAGHVRGFRSSSDAPITFRGIPYAATSRNQPPSPVTSWTGVRECFLFGPSCPQYPFGARALTEGMIIGMIEYIWPPLPPNKSYCWGDLDEERCLNLNVYTPSTAGRRPVLVWIHGGMFLQGSGVGGGMTDQTTLAARLDAVVIAINYRHGPFGFLHFPEHGITNLGIRDQIAALEWVRDNVEQFGGDKENVTICGESAGGSCVGTLLGSPRARGLFHGAIAMSGSCLDALPAKVYRIIFDAIEEAMAKDLQSAGGKLTPESFAAISQARVIDISFWLMLQNPQFAKLGAFLGLWHPYRGDDVVPLDGPHSNLVGAPPCLVGHMVHESKHLSAIFTKPGTREELAEAQLNILRAYFWRTASDDGPDDVAKWKAYANELADAIQSSRRKQGLPVELVDLRDAMTELLMWNDGTYCLARDACCFHYVNHSIVRDGDHGADLWSLFAGGHEDMKSMSMPLANIKPGQEEAFEKESEQLINVVRTFVQRKVPQVDGQQWTPFPMSMALKPQPELRAFPDEYRAWEEIKSQIMKDLRIDVALPQVTPR